MILNETAPWHKQSFDAFLTERLPRLLAERLPIAGYEVTGAGDQACRVAVTVSGGSAEVTVTYTDIPQPDAEGLFYVEGTRRVIVPTASTQDLEVAEIRCAGEQLYDYIEQRLGEAPADLPWDESLLRSFLPLDVWIRRFIVGEVDEPARPTSQPLDERNWLAGRTHLKRIIAPVHGGVTHPSHPGRVCPFETPEGPNIGRVFTVATGASIRDGRIVIDDDGAESALGVTASMVPFLEHNDPNRQLMGVNMMRQWLVPPDGEPACVQTGNEPNVPDFWCGRNLLTAFISWGADTFEDGIVVSESAARRLGYPRPLEPGDKLSNRHGTKGTVSRIAPDDEMPHLPDGTATELLFSFIGVHTRCNFGQVREAVMGRIARTEGAPAIVKPFDSPDAEQLRRMLADAGLDESGAETLTSGPDGPKLQRPSTVGWVYWGKTYHVAADKIHASVTTERCNLQGRSEYYQLRDVGAFETIAETFNTRSADRPDAETLAQRLGAGPVEQAPAPAPKFTELLRRLAMAGIRAELGADGIRFSFAAPPGETLTLACPVPHPWLRDRALNEVGAFDIAPEYAALVRANEQMHKLAGGQAPESLHDSARRRLTECLDDWTDALLTARDDVHSPDPGPVCVGNRVLFSGRTVITPGADLRIDQVGLADEIAWTLFSPLVQREIGDADQVTSRTPAAAAALDEVMARSWVIVNRAPSIMPTSLLAFHPIRVRENVIRLHPLATRLMNADFDGDQVAVFLPITEAGQREAGELLSVAGHLQRDPDLIRWLAVKHGALWGLAQLSRTSKGREQIAELAGVDVGSPEGFVTHDSLVGAMRAVFDRDGAQPMLDALERLTRLGFDAAARSGASISPFFGTTLESPPVPSGADPREWAAFAEETAERLISRSDYDDEHLGPQLLSVKCGARGSISHLMNHLGPRILEMPSAPESGGDTAPFVVRGGLRDGLPPAEMFAAAACARVGLAGLVLRLAQAGYGVREAEAGSGFTVLARAMRATHPGIVFARAAAAGEVDPLTDLDSRLFVGLPPR